MKFIEPKVVMKYIIVWSYDNKHIDNIYILSKDWYFVYQAIQLGKCLIIVLWTLIIRSYTVINRNIYI